MLTTRFLPTLLLAGLGSVLLACGTTDSDTLDREGVTNLPSGTGIGTAASGDYQAEIRTTACSGTCPVGACREGAVASGTLAVVQRDGYLSMTAFGGLLEGGIEKDGSFDVVGWTTVQAGALQQAFRSSGVHTGNGFNASIEARRWGSSEGQDIDCLESGIISGMRR
jgi:hypothetical protein